MKLEEKHISYIANKFNQLSTLEDLIELLNDVKKMIYGKDTDEITIQQFSYYANPNFSKKRYTTFVIKKKSGKDRTIHAPVSDLKIILQILNVILQAVYHPHKNTFGFVQNKSIVDNAEKHTGAVYVYNIDLKDFFHSFDRNRVKLGFMRSPFNLRKEKEPLAFLLASLTTHPLEINGETKTVLPQGAPTSPTITNILSKKLDDRLTGLAKRFHIKYSRYADDITFSSMHSVFKKAEFLNELDRIITELNLEINPEKTRLQKTGYRQEVTGLIVNEKVNVRRKYIKQLRNWLYLWERYGNKKANQIFKKDYTKNKGVTENIPQLEFVIAGKLEYLKMVKGYANPTYLKLKNKFDKLNDKRTKLTELISIWEKEGIDAAADYFNSNLKNEL